MNEFIRMFIRFTDLPRPSRADLSSSAEDHSLCHLSQSDTRTVKFQRTSKDMRPQETLRQRLVGAEKSFEIVSRAYNNIQLQYEHLRTSHRYLEKDNELLRALCSLQGLHIKGLRSAVANLPIEVRKTRQKKTVHFEADNASRAVTDRGNGYEHMTSHDKTITKDTRGYDRDHDTIGERRHIPKNQR